MEYLVILSSRSRPYWLDNRRMVGAEMSELEGRRILLVEDDYLIVQLIEDFLQAAGAEVIGPIGWLDEALAFIEHNDASIDCAVLDIDLHGEKSYPLADQLAARGIGFILMTGYGAGAVGDAYRHYPRCQKPFTRDVLITALAQMMA